MDSAIIFGAKYLFVAPVIIGAYVWLRQPNKKKIEMVYVGILSLALAFIMAKIVSKIYYDPRPFVKSGVKPLIAHAADNGFPSDHSWFTMTAAAVIFCYSRSLGWLAAAFAALVGLSRVLAHIHSPIDIVGAFAIGIIATYLARSATRPFYFKLAGGRRKDHKVEPPKQL